MLYLQVYIYKGVCFFVELLDLTKTGTAKKRARGKENVATSASKRPKAKVKATDKASKAKPTASKQSKTKKAKTNPTTKSKGNFVSKLYFLGDSCFRLQHQCDHPQGGILTTIHIYIT